MINKKLPAFANDNFPTKFKINARNKKASILTSKIKTNQMKNCLINYASSLYNELPLVLHNIQDVRNLKSTLDIHYYNKFKEKPNDRIISASWRDTAVV